MSVLGQVKEKLSMFNNFYDLIRVVDPINKKVVYSELQDGIAQPCYCFWNKGEQCKNCISSRAFLEQDTFIKLDESSGKIYFVVASNIEIEDKPYIVELLKDVTKERKQGDIGADGIKNLIEKLNSSYIELKR